MIPVLSNRHIPAIMVLAVCLFSFFKGIAQVSPTDLELIKTIYHTETSKVADSQALVVYTDRSATWEALVHMLHQKTTFGHGADTISLTKDDWKLLRLQMKKYPDFMWPNDLFWHSKRIQAENIHAYYVSLSKTKDSNNREAHHVYSFTKPLYIRNGTVAITGYALCDVETDCAFYKKVDGHWVRWITISSGVY